MCAEIPSNHVSGCISVAGREADADHRGNGRRSGFAARAKGASEGISSFAAKRDDVTDGRARGIEVEMFFAYF